MTTTKQLDEWGALFADEWKLDTGDTFPKIRDEDGCVIAIFADLRECPESLDLAKSVIASREAVPALIAEVRDLLEALGGRCQCGHYGKDHAGGTSLSTRYCKRNGCACQELTEATE